MEYNEKNGHTLGRIQQIALMSRIENFNATCRLSTQSLAHTIPILQGIKCCVQYLASHPHKNKFYPSNYYYESNVIILTCSGNQVED